MILLAPALASIVTVARQPVLIATPDMGDNGGLIINPYTAADQGLGQVEGLYVSIVGATAPIDGSSTVVLPPGGSFKTPPNVNVWVNALSDGHKFTAFFASPYVVPFPPVPVPGTPGSKVKVIFPPLGNTSLGKVIGSYLYQEYSDDDDLQGFVDAQNGLQQNYVDTFNTLNLPIYTGPVVAGKLLDWVGLGIYGMGRPALQSGISVQVGPLNTWNPDELIPLNGIEVFPPDNVVTTNDDLYRRILTWHLYKGDGNYFNARWLKRRVWRFLYGLDGTAPESVPPGIGDESIADTEQISVTIGANRTVSIRLVLGKRTVTGGAFPNMLGPNGFNVANGVVPPWMAPPITLDDIESTYVTYPPLPYMDVFQEAVASGVLELPYQFQFSVTIG